MLTKDLYDSIVKEAVQNNLEPALLLAVIDTESAGTAFWKIDGKDMPIVRFEGHYFYDRLSGTKRDKAVKEGLASPKVGGVANPSSGVARYALIERAALLDRDAAYESVSWGLGQVMGANWDDLGYKSVQDLVDSANTVEGQVDMIFKFIVKNNILEALRKKQWAKFAKVYNGNGYKANNYDAKLAKAYSYYLNAKPTEDSLPQQDELIQIQTMLNVVGSYGITVDGILGIQTKTAIRDFQLKNGLHVDGVYGPLTKEKLESKYVEISKKSTNMFGSATASIGMAGSVITEAAKSIQGFASTSHWIQIVFIGLTLLGVGITAYVMFFKKDSK